MISKPGAALVLLATVVAGVFCFRLQVDTRHDRLLEHDSAVAAEYSKFLDTFGSDEYVIIGLSGRPLFDEESLDIMLDALETLEAIPEVERVTGLPSIYRDRFNAEDLEAFEDEMTSTLFYRGLFLSDDYATAGLLVETVVLDTPAARRELVAALEEATASLVDDGFRVDLVGEPIFSVAINRLSVGESLRMFPIAAFASLIVLILLLRSARAIIVVLLCGVCTLVLLIGSISALGRPLNVITTAIPLVLWVLAIANCIHIIVHYQERLRSTENRRRALQSALDEVNRACILSAVTTALGFFSLVFASIGPIQEFGLFLGLGMLFSLVVNLVLGPYLLLVLKTPRPRWALAGTGNVFRGIGRVVEKMPVPIVVVSALLFVVCTFSLTGLTSDPDSMSFLPADSPLITSYDYVSENLTGTRTLELVIDTPEGWLTPSYWPPIEAMAREMEELEIVARAMSPLDFLKKANQWDNDLSAEAYKLPATREEAEELLDLFEEEDFNDLRRFVTADGSQIRLSVLVRTMKAISTDDLVQKARDYAAALPAPLRGTVTGQMTRMDGMQFKIMETQLKSYGAAFILIFIAIYIGLRSVPLTILSIPPNIIPMLSVFGIMVLLDIALDAATVMVASISLGIAVDDTVHFIVSFRRNMERGDAPREAIFKTLERVGPSITVTTITACIGFFTLSQSIFSPISYLGLLAGAAILMALVADLFLLPAIVMLTVGRRAARTGATESA